jgi:hypothetical protein
MNFGIKLMKNIFNESAFCFSPAFLLSVDSASSSLTDALCWENALLHMWKSDNGCHPCTSLGIPEHSWQENYCSSCPSCLDPHKYLCCKLEIKVENTGTLQIPETTAVLLPEQLSLLTYTSNFSPTFLRSPFLSVSICLIQPSRGSINRRLTSFLHCNNFICVSLHFGTDLASHWLIESLIILLKYLFHY